MTFIACGLNYKTAPLNIREQVSIANEAIPAALQNLCQLKAVNEAMILSTCNRTELYVECDDSQALHYWLATWRKLEQHHLKPYLYFHQNHAAVRHIMRVASGLDSMVLGEPQILGQLKQAFHVARDLGTVGNQLDRLLQTVFAVGKQVRSDTAIGASPVTLIYAATNLAKRIFTELSNCTVLLIGAGDMIELAGLHFANLGIKQIIVANRSIDKAMQLAQKFSGRGVAIADIPMHLKEADIVLTATASELPILGKGAVESALKARKHRPIFMVDIAVPRDIEPEVGDLEDVFLYNIDDLQEIIEVNKHSRQEASIQAEAIVELQVANFMRELQGLKAVDTICAYREKLEILREQELTKALDRLHHGEHPESILNEMSRNLINKIMHNPTVNLRQAACDGRLELLMLARKLFDIL